MISLEKCRLTKVERKVSRFSFLYFCLIFHKYSCFSHDVEQYAVIYSTVKTPKSSHSTEQYTVIHCTVVFM